VFRGKHNPFLRPLGGNVKFRNLFCGNGLHLIDNDFLDF
jgi:hypothetical protein